jgi:hypothetical protein
LKFKPRIIWVKQRIQDRGNLNSTQDLDLKEDLNIYEKWKHNKEGFEILSEIKN